MRHLTLSAIWALGFRSLQISIIGNWSSMDAYLHLAGQLSRAKSHPRIVQAKCDESHLNVDFWSIHESKPQSKLNFVALSKSITAKARALFVSPRNGPCAGHTAASCVYRSLTRLPTQFLDRSCHDTPKTILLYRMYCRQVTVHNGIRPSLTSADFPI